MGRDQTPYRKWGSVKSWGAYFESQIRVFKGNVMKWHCFPGKHRRTLDLHSTDQPRPSKKRPVRHEERTTWGSQDEERMSTTQGGRKVVKCCDPILVEPLSVSNWWNACRLWRRESEIQDPKWFSPSFCKSWRSGQEPSLPHGPSPHCLASIVILQQCKLHPISGWDNPLEGPTYLTLWMLENRFCGLERCLHFPIWGIPKSWGYPPTLDHDLVT